MPQAKTTKAKTSQSTATKPKVPRSGAKTAPKKQVKELTPAEKTQQTVEREEKRLRKIFSSLPGNEMAVAEGLIQQAARLRVQIDELWEDVRLHGYTETYQRSERAEPYERERSQARLLLLCDKNYQQVCRQLLDMVPASGGRSKLAALLRGDSDAE